MNALIFQCKRSVKSVAMIFSKSAVFRLLMIFCHGGTDECGDIPKQEIREIRGNDFQQKLIISFADDFFATDDTDECISLR